jgi:hypothetical protein
MGLAALVTIVLGLGASATADTTELILVLGVYVACLAAIGGMLAFAGQDWLAVAVVPVWLALGLLDQVNPREADSGATLGGLEILGAVVGGYVVQIIPLAIGFAIGRAIRGPAVRAARRLSPSDTSPSPSPTSVSAPPPPTPTADAPGARHAWVATAAVLVSALPLFFFYLLGGLVMFDSLIDFPDVEGVPTQLAQVWLVASLGLTVISLVGVFRSLRSLATRIDLAMERRRAAARQRAGRRGDAHDPAGGGGTDTAIPAVLGQAEPPDPGLAEEARRWHERRAQSPGAHPGP